MIDRLQELGAADGEEKVSDEQILNDIRRNDERVVRTGEIAEELPLTQNWTSKRLNKLESKGRVHSKSAGQGRVWWLDDAEPDHHVPEHIGDLMYYISQAQVAARNVLVMSVGLFVIGGLFTLSVILVDLVPGFGVVPFSNEDFVTAALLAGIGGALFLIAGLSLKLIVLLVERRFTGDTE